MRGRSRSAAAARRSPVTPGKTTVEIRGTGAQSGLRESGALRSPSTVAAGTAIWFGAALDVRRVVRAEAGMGSAGRVAASSTGDADAGCAIGRTRPIDCAKSGA